LDGLLSKMIEEKGVRIYRNEEVHYHQIDGIAFQPGAPYVCGIDNKSSKWKYFDTVTIRISIIIIVRMKMMIYWIWVC